MRQRFTGYPLRLLQVSIVAAIVVVQYGWNKSGQQQFHDRILEIKDNTKQKEETNESSRLFGVTQWNSSLWEGLSVGQLLDQGLHVTSRWPLRTFIDLGDRSAMGMKSRPKTIRSMSLFDAESRFYQLLEDTHVNCPNVRRIGKAGDGGWEMCVSGIYKPGKHCIVYSFGVADDWSFDDSMGKDYQCSVSAFDPSIEKDDHRRNDHVYFYKMGLGGADYVNKEGWKIRTLSSIKKLTGHTDEVIDYLKIDIEFGEWAAFETMVRNNSLSYVKQLGFEMHTHGHHSPENLLKWYNLLLGIEKQGFRRFWSRANWNGGRSRSLKVTCYELYYVNIRFIDSD